MARALRATPQEAAPSTAPIREPPAFVGRKRKQRTRMRLAHGEERERD